MKLQLIHQELLVRAIKDDVNKLYTYSGFSKSELFSEGELYLLHDLAREMHEEKQSLFIIINNGEECKIYMIYPVMDSYNGGFVVSGIVFCKAAENNYIVYEEAKP